MTKLLWKHQKEVFYWQKKIKHPGFNLDMRLGKTRLVVISVFKNKEFPCIIFCPYSGINGFEKELNLLKQDYIIIQGLKQARLRQLQEKHDFYITNHDCFRSIGLELAQKKWKSVVLDESTCIMNIGTDISTYFVKNFRENCRRYILAGILIPENESNFFQQMKFLNHEVLRNLGYDDFYKFKYYFFVKNIYGDDCTNAGKNFIAKLIKENCYSLTTKQAGLYIEKIYEIKKFKLNKKTIDSYKYFAKNFILEYDKKIYKVTDFSIALYTPLRLLCSGFIKNPDTLEYELIDSSKLNLLLNLMKTELIQSNVVIWCNFLIEVKFILKTLICKGILCNAITGATRKQDRNDFINDFQCGRTKVLIAMTSCFKMSTTLNKADCAIYFSSPLGYLTRAQTEKRISNPFVKKSDLIIDLVAEKTYEEKILKGNEKKRSKHKIIMDIVNHLRSV